MSDKIDIHDRALRLAWWALLAFVLAAVVAARIHLLQVPLERDEGEYAYAGQLMLQGIPPYKLAYNMKFPGTCAAYAGLMAISGQTLAGIHIGLLLINFAAVVFVFLIGKELFGTVCGIASASAYAVLSVSPSVLGFAAHATHFVVLPVLAGSYILLASSTRHCCTRRFAAGLLFGLAVLMKQQAVPFVAFGGFFLLLRDWRSRLIWRHILLRIVAFLLGAIFPILVTCLLLWKAGVFDTFRFWTINYAREYATRLSISEGLTVFRALFPYVLESNWAWWVLAPAGLVFSLWNRSARFKALTFCCPLLFFSALAVCPGFYFRSHYFIQILPAISLLAGTAAALVPFGSRLRSMRWVGWFVFAAVAAVSIWQQKDFFFRLSPAAASRAAYGLNPFPEGIRVAEFLRQRSTPDDKIAVIGSEPEIYFYAHRHSATGYIYTYALMEPQPYAAQMQREMIREIEAARPKYFVLIGFGYSWMKRVDSDATIFDWFNRYADANLRGIGLVNVISPDRTDYHLPYAGEPVQLSPNYILIFERKL
ncbi:MAG: ArnT family glycosyltransferase [Chthoniobacterales bacterium]